MQTEIIVHPARIANGRLGFGVTINGERIGEFLYRNQAMSAALTRGLESDGRVVIRNG